VGTANGIGEFQAIQIHDPRDLASAAQLIAEIIRHQQAAHEAPRGSGSASVASVHADREELRSRLAEIEQLARSLDH
jgi:hypothetical protein